MRSKPRNVFLDVRAWPQLLKLQRRDAWQIFWNWWSQAVGAIIERLLYEGFRGALSPQRPRSRLNDKKRADNTYDNEKEKAARSLFKKLIEDIGDLPICEILAHYRDYGFRGVVTKPYSIEELGKVLQELLPQA